MYTNTIYGELSLSIRRDTYQLHIKNKITNDRMLIITSDASKKHSLTFVPHTWLQRAHTFGCDLCLASTFRSSYGHFRSHLLSWQCPLNLPARPSSRSRPRCWEEVPAKCDVCVQFHISSAEFTTNRMRIVEVWKCWVSLEKLSMLVQEQIATEITILRIWEREREIPSQYDN